MSKWHNLSLKLSFVVAMAAPVCFAQSGLGPITTQVQWAKPRVGTQSTTIAPGFKLVRLVDGSFPIENPSGPITTFGILTDGTLTEPDQNLYIELHKNPGGPVPGFDYGRHFLFQPHENGENAYVTRINLDVTSKAHKVTLLTPIGKGGTTGLSAGDGSTYDPLTNTGGNSFC